MRYIVLLFLISLLGCTKSVPEKEESDVRYNLIQPLESIYKIVKSNVTSDEIPGKYFEKEYFLNRNLVKIERYDQNGQLTDELGTPAISVFEYDQDDNLKFFRYYNKFGRKAEDKKLKFWSKEIIRSSSSTVIEFYSDTTGNLLTLPSESESQSNHIAPVIVYIETPEGTLIKAFDSEFNLLSEEYGEKPCIPFIDCGGVR